MDFSKLASRNYLFSALSNLLNEGIRLSGRRRAIKFLQSKIFGEQFLTYIEISWVLPIALLSMTRAVLNAIRKNFSSISLKFANS